MYSLLCAAHLPTHKPTSGPRLAAALGFDLGVQRFAARGDWMIDTSEERPRLWLRAGLAPAEMNLAACEGLAAHLGLGWFDETELALTIAMPREVLALLPGRAITRVVADYFVVPMRAARARLRALGWLASLQRAEPASGSRLRCASPFADVAAGT